MSGLVAGIAVKGIAGGALNVAKGIGSAIGTFLKSLNAQGVIGLCTCIALLFLWLHTAGEARHWKKQDDRDVKALHVQQEADAKLAAQAQRIKNDLDSIGDNISVIWKGWNDAQISRIASSARVIRLRGPGKAACDPEPASPSGGSQQSSGTGNASVASVPPVQGLELIGLPFSSTVDFAQEHDDYRSESLTWRSWYAALLKSWPKPSQSSKESNR